MRPAPPGCATGAQAELGGVLVRGKQRRHLGVGALDQQWLPCCFKGTRPLLGVAQPSTVSGRS